MTMSAAHVARLAEISAVLAASDKARIENFNVKSKAFPVGTKVRTARGAQGVIVAEKGKRGHGVTTLRIQFDGVDYVSRMTPDSLTRV